MKPNKFAGWWFALALALPAASFLYFSFGRQKSRGAALYAQYCSSCHMENGKGLRGLIPPLAGADYLRGRPEQLACIIQYGLEGEIRVNGQSYDRPMPGNPKLSATEIGNLANYLQKKWGRPENVFPLDKIRQQLRRCHAQSDKK